MPGEAFHYQLRIDTKQLRVLSARAHLPLNDPKVMAAMGAGIRAWGALVQARAVRNVSGYPVVYDGGVFRVQVRTSTLKGSIELQWPYQSNLQARVFVNGTHTANVAQPGGSVRSQSVADYAAAIEMGHKAIDLKQFMQGKVVPFFGARGKSARGPFAARGLTPAVPGSEDYGSQWQSEHLNNKLAAKGKAPMYFTKKGGGEVYQAGKKGGSTYFIAFRRVGKTGWIIPAAKPRPFMRAAVTGTLDQGRLLMIRYVAPAFDPRS